GGRLTSQVEVIEYDAGGAVGIIGADDLAVVVDGVGRGDATRPGSRPGSASQQIIVCAGVTGSIRFGQQDPCGRIIAPSGALVGNAGAGPGVRRRPGGPALEGAQFGQLTEAIVNALLGVRNFAPDMLALAASGVIVPGSFAGG